MTDGELRIGTAGWSISGAQAALFPGGGSHLERYARVLPAVEIDSTFYRSHRTATYARWSLSVPDGVRFSVKAIRSLQVDGDAATAFVIRRDIVVVEGL